MTDRVGVLARGARIQFIDVYLDEAIRQNQGSPSAFGQCLGATHRRVPKVCNSAKNGDAPDFVDVGERIAERDTSDMD